jgi:threonine aldolase
VLAALARANVGHASGYGHDPLTERVHDMLREQFGEHARPFLVFNGTAANVLCVRAACRPWEAVICAYSSHLNYDECGASESIAGVKLLTCETEHGKLIPETIRGMVGRIGDEHAVQPKLVSISQCTELGTVYTQHEVSRLADTAHDLGLLLHIDGARLANAAAATEVPLDELTTAAGVDLVSFGGTKNGLLGAEAVVILKPELAEGFQYLRKQSLQLASKMRFLAAQFEALLTDELWLECARQANRMATLLAKEVEGVARLQITHPVEANAVFAIIPREATRSLQERFPFYVWDEQTGEVRWMCSWDTTEDDVFQFAAAVRNQLS